MRERKEALANGASPRARGKRFNFIDFLIILAVVLLAAIVINMFFPVSWFNIFDKNSSSREIQYTVEFMAVDEALIEKIKENDNVVDSVSKYTLGTVVTVNCSSHYTELEYNEEEKSGWLSPFPDKYNVLVTVTANADYEEGKGYSVGDRRIAVGEKLALRFPDYVGEGYCVSLSEAK